MFLLQPSFLTLTLPLLVHKLSLTQTFVLYLNTFLFHLFVYWDGEHAHMEVRGQPVRTDSFLPPYESWRQNSGSIGSEHFIHWAISPALTQDFKTK